jgi:hypothetical protein
MPEVVLLGIISFFFFFFFFLNMDYFKDTKGKASGYYDDIYW